MSAHPALHKNKLRNDERITNNRIYGKTGMNSLTGYALIETK
jgi:hypothetical protein